MNETERIAFALAQRNGTPNGMDAAITYLCILIVITIFLWLLYEHFNKPKPVEATPQ